MNPGDRVPFGRFTAGNTMNAPEFKYRVVQAGSENTLGGFHSWNLAVAFAAAMTAPGGCFECQLLRVEQFYPGGGFFAEAGLDREEA